MWRENRFFFVKKAFKKVFEHFALQNVRKILNFKSIFVNKLSFCILLGIYCFLQSKKQDKTIYKLQNLSVKKKFF